MAPADIAFQFFSFASLEIDTVAARNLAASPRLPACAYWQEAPLRNAIEARDSARFGKALYVAALAVAWRFGWGAVDSEI